MGTKDQHSCFGDEKKASNMLMGPKNYKTWNQQLPKIHLHSWWDLLTIDYPETTIH